jgi:hypothetical protein
MSNTLLVSSIILIAGASCYLALRQTTKDPYGLFHLSLNAGPGKMPERAKTEWLNMGYWKARMIRFELCIMALKLCYRTRLLSLKPVKVKEDLLC